MSFKIATFGDVHIGYTTYGTIDAQTGLNTRVLNCLKSFDKMIDYCIENDIKYGIFAGDMFKNNLPSPNLQRELNVRIQRMVNSGMTLYMMDGNHDVSPIETSKSAMDCFSSLKIQNVYHTRFVSEYYLFDRQIKLLVLPTYCNQEDIECILDSKLQENIPTIIVGHCTILGAKLNDWLLEQNEDAIDSKIFERDNVIAAIFGHLHKHQILNNKPLTYYTGSLQRIDFTEENQPKGFVVLEIDNNDIKHEFIEIESQRFFTIKQSLINSSNEHEELISIIDKNKNKLKDSICRIIVDVNKDNNIDDPLILNKLKQIGVSHVANIQKIVEKDVNRRNKNINEELTELKALEMYFENHENKDHLINIGCEMIKDLSDKGMI